MYKPANDNKDSGWKESTTFQYLQNLKNGMDQDQAMKVWGWQNKAKKNAE